MKLVLSAKRMMEYLPRYWHEYLEVKEIFHAVGAELDELETKSERILTDAFIMTMCESRIKEWEHWLGLPPTGTLEDRRLTILSYFSVITKMSKESIQTLVVRLYQGARSIVRLKDSSIKITIKPLPEHANDPIEFEILVKQLEKLKPCHIGLFVDRYVGTWGEVLQGHSSWGQVRLHGSWQEVYDFILE